MPEPPYAGAYTNANVLPMTTPDARASAVCWSDGKIVAVGSDEEVRRVAHARGIVPLDAEGRALLPGFVDAHMHLLHVGIRRTRPDLAPCRSRGEVLATIGAWHDSHEGDGAVIGEGWDEAAWPDQEPPTRRELDRISSDRPLVARRICGHVATANTAALEAIWKRWDDPQQVDRETGRVLEAPSLYLNEVLPSPPEEADAAVLEACSEAHALGVTSVAAYEQAPYRAALQRAAAQGSLALRVSSNIYVQQLAGELASGFRTGRAAAGPSDRVPRAAWLPPVLSRQPWDEVARAQTAVVGGSGTGADAQMARPARTRSSTAEEGHMAPRGPGTSHWLQDGGLKVFLDGSLGGHTALLREPYADRPDHTGMAIWSDDELDRIFLRAHKHGIQVHAHAIGDGAVAQGLDAFQRLKDAVGDDWWEDADGARGMAQEPEGGQEEGGAAAGTAGTARPPRVNRMRHRFEHYEIVPDELLRRTVELGIAACSQPNFVGEWSAKGGMYEQRLGQRFSQNNRFGAFREQGLAFSFGSDGMPFGPLRGIAAAVGHPDPAQRLRPEEAVWYYTRLAAWSIHQDDGGSLAPGQRADLVLLETASLECDPNDWGVAQTITYGIPRLPQWPGPR